MITKMRKKRGTSDIIGSITQNLTSRFRISSFWIVYSWRMHQLKCSNRTVAGPIRTSTAQIIFFIKCVSNWQLKDNEENKSEITETTNDNLFCQMVTIYARIDDWNIRDDWWNSCWSWRQLMVVDVGRVSWMIIVIGRISWWSSLLVEGAEWLLSRLCSTLV